MTSMLVFYSPRRYDRSREGVMQKLYDHNMNLVGYMVQSETGRTSVCDSDFQVLGYYYPESNKTYDKNMRLIGKGNLLAGLLGLDVQAGS